MIRRKPRNDGEIQDKRKWREGSQEGLQWREMGTSGGNEVKKTKREKRSSSHRGEMM